MASRSTGISKSGLRSTNVLQLLGEPGEGDLFVTPPALELLDAAVGEVHQVPRRAQANACCISVACSSTWRLCEPTDGADDSGRETRRSGRPSNSPLKCSATCGHGPWLAGSSWTQRTSRALGYFAISALSSATGRG